MPRRDANDPGLHASAGVAKPWRSAQRTKMARLRLQRGLTQFEVASRSRIAPSTYERLEQGDLWNPRIRHLANIAIVLGVALEDVIEDDWRGWSELEAEQRQGRS